MTNQIARRVRAAASQSKLSTTATVTEAVSDKKDLVAGQTIEQIAAQVRDDMVINAAHVLREIIDAKIRSIRKFDASEG